MKTSQPLLLIICGPNGAGKTTLRRVVLGELPFPFINADEIALAEFGPEQTAEMAYKAAKLAARLREELVAARCSFGFEMVLSDSEGAKVGFLRNARGLGYWVSAHFVGLDSPELSQARVIQRVHAGGHDIPDEKIVGRFPRVIAILRRLLDVPDELSIYDNSSAEEPFRVIAKLSRGELTHLSAASPDGQLRWSSPLAA